MDWVAANKQGELWREAVQQWEIDARPVEDTSRRGSTAALRKQQMQKKAHVVAMVRRKLRESASYTDGGFDLLREFKRQDRDNSGCLGREEFSHC